MGSVPRAKGPNHVRMAATDRPEGATVVGRWTRHPGDCGQAHEDGRSQAAPRGVGHCTYGCRCLPIPPGRGAAPRGRRHGHVAGRPRGPRRRMHGGVERAGADARGGDPRVVRRRRCPPRPHEHVRCEPIPPGAPRARRPVRRAVRRRRRARARRRRTDRRGFDGPAGHPPPTVRTGASGGCVRRVPRTGRRPRGRGRRPARGRDPERSAGARAGRARRARRRAGRRADRERDVHPRRSDPLGVAAR